MSKDKQFDIAVQALRDIVNPIGNWRDAVAGDPSNLRSIAAEALRKMGRAA